MARLVTMRVLSSVVPSGSSNSTVKYPWSSVGRKLVGMRRYNKKINTITIPNPAVTRLGFFIMRLIPATYLLFPKSSQRFIVRNTRFLGLLGSLGFNISEHITGLSVRATTVESNTETGNRNTELAI